MTPTMFYRREKEDLSYKYVRKWNISKIKSVRTTTKIHSTRLLLLLLLLLLSLKLFRLGSLERPPTEFANRFLETLAQASAY